MVVQVISIIGKSDPGVVWRIDFGRIKEVNIHEDSKCLPLSGSAGLLAHGVCACVSARVSSSLLLLFWFAGLRPHRPDSQWGALRGSDVISRIGRLRQRSIIAKALAPLLRLGQVKVNMRARDRETPLPVGSWWWRHWWRGPPAHALRHWSARASKMPPGSGARHATRTETNPG